MPKQIDDIIRHTAKELNLNIADVELVLRAEFKLLRNTISDGKLKSMMLPFIGKFYVTEEKRIYWTKKRRDLDETNISD